MVYEFDPVRIAGITVMFVIGFLIIIGILAWGFNRLRQMVRNPDLLGMSKDDIKKRWQQIEELMARNDELSYKLAVMEADKLLDHGLKAMAFGGTTLGERLKVAVYKYPKLRNVWPAHITRNKLVHEASYHLPKSQAHSAVYQFKEALKELGIL